MLEAAPVKSLKGQRPQGQRLSPADTDVDTYNRDGAGEGDSTQAMAMARIAALGSLLAQKRKDAIDHRKKLGIEDDWEEDEEFYQAIDAANPEGDTHARPSKPVTQDGSASATGRAPGEARSSVFIPITRAYVDSAAARVADMLLPNDDKPWQIKPTPVADTGPMAQQTAVAQASAGVVGNAPMPPVPGGMPGFAPAAPQAVDPTTGYAPGGQVKLPMGVSSSALSDEEKRAEAASQRIEDWLVECGWNGEVRKVIEDAAKVGTGVLKGPFPVRKTVRKMARNPDGTTRMVRQEMVVPISKRVSYRHFYPAPDCGENHQDGSYTFEYDSIGARGLRDLANDNTYIRENIIKVLREGPNMAWSQDTPGDDEMDRLRLGTNFPLWYFYGDLDRDSLLACGLTEEELGGDEDEQLLTVIPAMVIMVNDTVIKAALNPLESGGFPYDVFPWQRREGMPWGKGIARQMRTPQRMLNASVRSMMDNAGLTSGPIWAIRKGWIEPIDGVNAISPRKGFYMKEGAPPQAKIQDAISFENITSNIAEVQKCIELANKFAEEATGLPMLMQGQQGEATRTVGGMTILNNNGSVVLRRIARTFDDNITEPQVTRYYEWLMENQGNEECKGDFQIDARGSSFLVERDLQNQALNQLAPLFMQHPDVHKGRFAEELARANRLNFNRFMMTEAEKQAAAQQPPPKAPAVEAAEIRAASAERIAEADRQVDAAKLQKDFELGLADLEQKGNLSADNIKAMLATKVMELRARRQDADANRVASATSKAADRADAADARADERDMPPGRAPAGEAFSR